MQATYAEALPALVTAWTRAQHAGSCSPEEVQALQTGAVRCALDLTMVELQVRVCMWAWIWCPVCVCVCCASRVLALAGGSSPVCNVFYHI